MSFSKIIVGTDFSDQAQLAIDHSIAIGRHTGAEVVLAHALSMPAADFVSPYPIAAPQVYGEQIEEIVTDARKKLSDLRERMQGQGAEISQIFVNEMPDRGMVSVAEEMSASLVVVGSHGRTGLSRFLIGSVAEKIVRKAPCDVLVARGEAPQGGYRRILVPVDFSEVSDQAVARAAALVEPGGTVDLLHTWQLPGGSITYWGKIGEELGESIQKGALDFGAKCIKKVGTDKATFSVAVEQGDAADRIEKRAKSGDYDLVVMGSHGRKGLNRVVLGSVCERAVRHLKTSVYITRVTE